MSQIPSKKHTDSELADLRARSSMTAQGETMVATYNKKRVSKPLAIIGYILALGAPAWLILRKIGVPIYYSMTDVYIIVACITLSIAVALFIIFTRSLSRHHGCFIIILALICSFSLVNILNTDRNVYRQTMALFGKDIPESKAPEIKPIISPEMQALEREIQAIENKRKKP